MTPYPALSAHASTPGPSAASPRGGLVDGFGRKIAYLRLSVTDRCDLRCTYCMAETMRFLPKAEVLSLEELDRLASAFIALGTRKLRLTGGEPLVRKGVLSLVRGLSRHLDSGDLDELTLTTNGTRLAEHAAALANCGVRRVNVSLDTLRPDLFRTLTRGGDLARVIGGVDAALAAGLRVKINAVALARDNRAELPVLMTWAHARGCDLTLIETMPLGEVEADRTEQYLSVSAVRDELAAAWTLTPSGHETGGPARYYRVRETGGLIGFISPLSHSFCDTCNRLRVTCTGTLHTCLGREDETDLRAVMRSNLTDDAPLHEAILAAVAVKSLAHDFRIGPGSAPALARHMSRTGG